MQVTVDSNGQPVDKVFYHRFWSLQQAFQRPEEHMDPAPWSAAVSCIAEVLQHFSKEEASSGNAQIQADGATQTLTPVNCADGRFVNGLMLPCDGARSLCSVDKGLEHVEEVVTDCVRAPRLNLLTIHLVVVCI